MSKGQLKIRRCRLLKLGTVLALAALNVGCTRPLPPGISYAGDPAPASDIAFLADETWVDSAGARHVRQEIFDEVLAIIGQAEQFIVLDMFLYNDFQGPIPETTRALSQELTAALIERKRELPRLEIVVISDPVNTLYGSLPSPYFEQLRNAGVRVIVTNLDALRDSNPVYSAFWRLIARPFGNRPGTLLPNPIGRGRVSLRTYLALLNFKANHRKTLLADAAGGYVGLVSSANPHDGSSAHRNAAIRFNGPAVIDLLQTENAALTLSGREPLDIGRLVDEIVSATTVEVVTERAIETAILNTLMAAQPGDRIDLMMFYLSDRDVIGAFTDAHERGVLLRLLLDPNKDAFGRQKNGIPNRLVAAELNERGIPIRWCDTHGEQCHAKLLLHSTQQLRSTLISGSSNFTRRNLDGFNLETDVVVHGAASHQVFRDAQGYFDSAWNNVDGRGFSVDYAAYADESRLRYWLYRFMEASGFSSF